MGSSSAAELATPNGCENSNTRGKRIRHVECAQWACDVSLAARAVRRKRLGGMGFARASGESPRAEADESQRAAPAGDRASGEGRRADPQRKCSGSWTRAESVLGRLALHDDARDAERSIEDERPSREDGPNRRGARVSVRRSSSSRRLFGRPGAQIVCARSPTPLRTPYHATPSATRPRVASGATPGEVATCAPGAR